MIKASAGRGNGRRVNRYNPAMKYAIILPDGAADHPLEALEGRTPFQVARKPNIDAIAIEGRQGTVATTPEGYAAGSDICSMALLGYDPVQYHPGRAPLEAAAMGLPIEPGQWVFRCNLVTVIDGEMADHSAGHIQSPEGRRLLADFAAMIQSSGLADGLDFYPGVSYRNIMVDRSGRTYDELITTPPHDIPGEAIRKYLPKGGEHAALIQKLIAASAELFANHEVNMTRREMGEREATHVWLWGQGTPRVIDSFEKRFGLRGAMITAVDLLAGIAALIGWDRLHVDGITGYHDTNYIGKGQVACDALDHYDVVAVHIEAPDEASHQADAATKVASIEAIDKHIVAPILKKLKTYDEGWRVLLMPDHYTCVETRKHDPTPPPFCMAGKNITGVRHQPFTEENAIHSDLHIEYGHELMEFFLRSGL
ncbi:MAG: cofactor-independent phosphoglycerate mutase [Planctomycetes bacterium]|nr:cofactor-independent phosphoglycerate mutase [Planctomycetota bacterium]